VALGEKWIGRTVSEGVAMFLSAEDDESELHRRADAVAGHYGRALGDMERLLLQSVAGEDALLATLQQGGGLADTPLLETLNREMARHCPALVVLDTLADLFPGNENDRVQARQFIGKLRGLALEHACAVVLLAHPSLSGLNTGSGTSGSTGWNNSVRSRIYLERVIMSDGGRPFEPNPDARALSVKKGNYARSGGEIRLLWQDGVFVPEAPADPMERAAASMKAERVFMDLLRLHNEQGRNVNASGGQNYAPKAFESHAKSEGVQKRAFKQAMDALLDAGKIRVAEDGPPSKRRKFLVAVE
jgi:RecA-family ATPase